MHGCMAKGEGGIETRRWRRNHIKVEGIMWFVWRVETYSRALKRKEQISTAASEQASNQSIDALTRMLKRVLASR